MSDWWTGGLREYFPNTISGDFLRLMLGDFLGEGAYRRVYACAIDKSLVVKFEIGQGCFQNVLEYETWQRVAETEHARWFAPVTAISPCGTVLMQKRTQPVTREQLPDKTPAFFTDQKVQNWGLLDGNPVCHDYGLTLLMERGMSKRLCKAEWWGDEAS